MKYIHLMPYLLLAMLLTTKSLSALDTSSVKYLPLKTGNIWVYQYDCSWPPPWGVHYRYQVKVLRDTIIGNHKFYYASGLPINCSCSWLRVDSVTGNVYTLNLNPQCPGSNIELIDSLASGVNDLSYICRNPSVIRKCTAINTIIQWGQQTTNKSFDWTSGPASAQRTYLKYFGLNYAAYGEINPQIYTMTGCILDGVLYGDTSLVGIQRISNEVPTEFVLFQNYPNPFNPVTRISFAIPPSKGARGMGENKVVLRIYDILGREVATLVNEPLKPGTYEVEWDGSNFSSGVYFYKLTAGDASAPLSITKKMVLIK